MDKTLYKRDKDGKKIEKEMLTKIAHLKFKNRSVKINKKIFIGRNDTNDIAIKDDPLVSRKHALIEKIKNFYYVSDMESTNGTYVNNNPIIKNQKIKLNNGDIIRIGKTEFKIL